MKNLLSISTIAVAVLFCSQQQASSWIKFQRNVNRSIGFQSGGNNFAWGLWKNDQPNHGGFHGEMHQYPMMPMQQSGPTIIYDYHAPAPKQQPKQQQWTPPTPRPSNGDTGWYQPSYNYQYYQNYQNYYYPAYWQGW